MRLGSDGTPFPSIAMTAAPDDLVFYGTVEPTETYAITLRKDARRELGLETRDPLFVFGSPSRKQMIVTRGPESAPDLLDLLSTRRKKK
jgi:hypothetical protein